MSKKEIAAERLLDGSLGILQVPEVANRLGDHTDSLKGALDRVAPTDINPDGFLELQSGRGTIPLIIRSIGEGADYWRVRLPWRAVGAATAHTGWL